MLIYYLIILTKYAVVGIVYKRYIKAQTNTPPFPQIGYIVIRYFPFPNGQIVTLEASKLGLWFEKRERERTRREELMK